MPNKATSGQNSLALLTDLYQLTMAYGYWHQGMAERPAVFHLFFRQSPFQGGYAIAAGLQSAIEYIQQFKFNEEDLAFLAEIKGNDNQRIFSAEFLRYLSKMELQLDIDAMPEGTVVFPHEPLVRVRGPLLQAQLLETALLNIVNFQTLIATKAARIVRIARDEPVLEFGLRRAQGIDGALTASRAAYIGGCAATSNVLAGKLWGIPVRGTHAHSWVMSFDDERTAFAAYAEAMPNNCVFLVDTFDTLTGVGHAIEVGKSLRASGHEMVGVRLDSGDLAYLSVEARRMLDEAGFPNATVVASNDLDEHLMESLRSQGAAISVWGVGTKLITAFDQPALGGVYKLGALMDDTGQWVPKLKLSEQMIKTSTPGTLQVRRYYSANQTNSAAVVDMIFDENNAPEEPATLVDPLDPTHHLTMNSETSYVDLLLPIFRSGKLLYQPPALLEIRERRRVQMAMFHNGVLRLSNPHKYPVGLESALSTRKADLIHQARYGNR